MLVTYHTHACTLTILNAQASGLLHFIFGARQSGVSQDGGDLRQARGASGFRAAPLPESALRKAQNISSANQNSAADASSPLKALKEILKLKVGIRTEVLGWKRLLFLGVCAGVHADGEMEGPL